MTLHFSVFLIE